jgi:membrane protein DedA with SNARE-associated domain
MDTIGQFLDQYGLLAIFTLLLVKGLGVPIPVPGDFLMLLAGVRAGTGQYTLIEVIVALMGATLLAAGVQYLLARGPSRGFVYRFGRYIGLTPPRLDRAAGAVRKRGATAVAVGTVTPGLSMVTYIASGLAELAAIPFSIGLVIGSTIFVALHIALGYIFGPGILTALDSVHIPLLPVAIGLAVLGLVVWLARTALRRRKAALASTPDDTLRTLHAWTEAACPVCMIAGRLNVTDVVSS